MTKKLISLSDPCIEWLRKEAARLDIKVSDLIRRILDEKRLTPPFVILLAMVSVFASMGCASDGAGIRTTLDTPDASPDLGSVVAAVEGSPDVWTAPDLAPAPDLRLAPDTTPALQPDAWQAPSLDLGTDIRTALDGGVGDVLAVTVDAMPGTGADTFCSTVGYSIYCLPDAGKPPCSGPDPSFCASVPDDRLFGPSDMGYCANTDYIIILDGGNRVLYRENCHARCGLCAP
jgi:hypothetical protein